jgi:two-component system response regulator FixJ
VLIERGCHLPVIFLSAEADVRTAVNVLQRGAVDLIEKESCEAPVLIESVRRAIAKDAAQRAYVLELNDLRQRAAEMTPREVEVADLLADGKSNRQTALALGLSERTVEIHRGRIMAKMRCESIVNFGVQWLKLQQARKSLGNPNIPR